jgi:outer membrane protein assembly factor BamB
VTCRYDLDGKCIWRRLDNEGSFFEHGYSTSPLLADGKVIVFMNKMIAFDASTGERLWTTEFTTKDAQRFHGTPAAARIGQTAVCVLPTGHILRLSDGKIIRDKGPEFGNQQQEIPSPVVMGDTVYELSTYSKLHKVVLPAEASEPLANVAVRTVKIDVSRYPTYYMDWFMASPLIHEGLAYCVNNTGVLTVFDIEKMEVVYQKLLDVDHYQSVNEGPGRGIGISPSLAGGKIYIVGDTGTTLVIKPGRAYEQLAKNKIESVVRRYWSQRTERFISAPVFDGKRMYLRGERYLYCIAND